MNINKVKKLSNSRYKIEFDNKNSVILYEDVIIDNNLLYKKEINNDLLKKIEKENLYYEAYYKTLKYVMTKMRSIYEVEVYLNKMDIKDKDKIKIINKLKDIKLLNDELYAEAFISDKINLTNDGPLKIKKELKDKKIDDDIIEDILNKYDEDIFTEKVNKLLSKKKNTKYSNYIFKQKLLTYFINLGYDSSFILPILNNIEANTNDLIKKEYDLLYKKLSKKYDSDKLEYEIKTRLYRKGFSMDEINNIKE